LIGFKIDNRLFFILILLYISMLVEVIPKLKRKTVFEKTVISLCCFVAFISVQLFSAQNYAQAESHQKSSLESSVEENEEGFEEEAEEEGFEEEAQEEGYEEETEEEYEEEAEEEVEEEGFEEEAEEEHGDEISEESVDQQAVDRENEIQAVVKKSIDRTKFPRIVGSMKDNMYQHVTTDESIATVEQWIKEGRKNDDYFKDKILPIMKDDCSKCHSTSSTMSKGIPELPLTSYEEIIKFTKLSPADLQCEECHADPALKNHADKNLNSIYIEQGLKQQSAHTKVPCVRCHFDLHLESDEFCQDAEIFKQNIIAAEPDSTLNCQQIKKPDCSRCHNKVADKISNSTHFVTDKSSETKMPQCIDCHRTHDVVTSKQDKTNLNIINDCGNCHNDLLESYLNSYHGKVARLGSEKSAKCVNCHGSHEMLNVDNPASPLHTDNIQKTCAECHTDVNANFVGFIPHANHYDQEKYPKLFYSFWGMTGLLLLVFVAFGIHTFLWFTRSLLERAKMKKEKLIIIPQGDEKHVRRFTLSQTVIHLMIIVSFLSLALTGMSLKFPENPFFFWVTQMLGGPHAMGYIHRIGAVITLAYVAVHFFQLAGLFWRKQITLKGLFKEEYSLIPLWRDVKDIKANVLYFIGKGPKPAFGRWTYWEKFDYLAVFWGVLIIGATGLVLWFPEEATTVLPGWALNVATIIHSDEALLATVFIFVVHFFHTHLRPESLPMDSVIFTQRMPLSKFKEERPKEYASLLKSGKLEELLVAPPKKWFSKTVLAVGLTFLAIGVLIVIAIIYSLIASL